LLDEFRTYLHRQFKSYIKILKELRFKCHIEVDLLLDVQLLQLGIKCRLWPQIENITEYVYDSVFPGNNFFFATMQLDNLKKELSPDEQEILLTFKKNKASFKDTTGTVMTVLALIAVMMLTLLVVHFTGTLDPAHVRYHQPPASPR
jgi:hypothetical protein